MHTVSISVVTPTYNRGEELPRAIRSAVGQSLAPLEILVIDDGSTDATAEIVRRLAEPRVRLIRHDRNRGAAAARNTGILNARGEWIAFLDSDDEWAADKLLRQVEALSSAAPMTLACVCGFVLDDRRRRSRSVVSLRGAAGTKEALVWGCAVSPGSTLLVARCVFQTVGNFDDRLKRLEDWDWLMRFSREYSFAVVAEPLATIHKSDNPAGTAIADAVVLLRERHRARWYGQSSAAGRKFDSTLLVEEATGAFYAGDHRWAIRLIMQALLTYPFRNRRFFEILRRVAADLVRDRARKLTRGTASPERPVG
jgi:glycosyltransferase involved in cell wall biosynthesis